MSDVQQDSNTWSCPQCILEFRNESPFVDMSFAFMKKHMLEIHKIDISGKQYSKNMLLHLDDADFHLTQYEWDIQGIKMIQNIKVMRQSYKDRMARKEAKQASAPAKPQRKFKRLEDTDKFPFGQYRKQDKTFNEVPAEYLDWPWMGERGFVSRSRGHSIFLRSKYDSRFSMLTELHKSTW